jgi:mRNA interferase RelE/StbE
MFKVILSKTAKEQYDKLNEDTKKKANKAIEYLGVNPFFGANIKKLKGELKTYWRYRIGDFRLIYGIGGGSVFINTIEHRGKVY